MNHKLVALLSGVVGALLLLIGTRHSAQAGPDPIAMTQLFLPVVVSSERTSQPEGPGSSCSPNVQEQQIAERMMQHMDQQRATLICDPILVHVARERARDMALRRYVSHTNPDGIGPNFLVQQAGYPLPSYYGTARDANSIESMAAGYATTDAVWSSWMNSNGHRTHILGQHSFYAAQVEYGIGYFYDSDPNSPQRHYWVIITAQRGE